jgi:hypothetical protein
MALSFLAMHLYPSLPTTPTALKTTIRTPMNLTALGFQICQRKKARDLNIKWLLSEQITCHSEMDDTLGESPHPPSNLACCLYITFFASPGRFFAATELKAMLAHVLLSYDVKFESEGVRPASVRFGPSSLPNRSATVMFRKRQI